MRGVSVKGIDDKLSFSLGSDVEVIYYVMQNGKAIDAITFELEMAGSELLELINKFNLNQKIDVSVNENNKYLLTAYDW